MLGAVGGVAAACIGRPAQLGALTDPCYGTHSSQIALWRSAARGARALVAVRWKILRNGSHSVKPRPGI